MKHRTELRAPTWATAHQEDDGGIRWIREVAVEIEPEFIRPDAEPGTAKVMAVMSDNLEVVGGIVTVTRGDVDLYVDSGSDRMTPRQARAFASAIISMADAIDGGAMPR